MLESKSPPALLRHAHTVYEAMQSQSENGVYEGYLTKLFADCGLSVPQYTPVMRELQRMDCVIQLKRGGGTTPSQWQLVQPPDDDLFDAMRRKGVGYGRSRRANYETLQQSIRDLSIRLHRIENAMGFAAPDDDVPPDSFQNEDTPSVDYSFDERKPDANA